MQADTVIRWVRGVLLMGLLAYFAVSLHTGLMRDERAGNFGRLPQGTGTDPGVRVLLANRLPRSGADPVLDPPRWHDDRVELNILQPVLVVTPDDPDNPERRLELKAGVKLTVLVNSGDGLMLSSRGWGPDGRDLTWNVSRVRITPVTTFPIPAEGESPGRRDPTRFEAADRDAVFTLGVRRYRGSAEILWHSPKDLAVVNCLPMEAYVEGVVAVEMSPSYPLEALKAQAILSRSYAYARRLPNLSSTRPQPFDVVDGIEDQDYRGTGNGSRVVTQAVIDTRGTITCTDLSHGAYPFSPLFCASSGGYTTDVRAVIERPCDAYGRPLPAGTMSPRKDEFCLPGAEGLGYQSSHWTTSTVLEPRVIREKLSRHLKQAGDPRQVGYIKDLKAGRRDMQSNRVQTVLVYHSLPEAPPLEIPAHTFRMIMGPSLIRSTLWSADSPKRIDSPDNKYKNYLIKTCGYGHGVGMSQISAWEMARQGIMAKAIIEYFYHQGVVLRNVW